MLLYLFNKSLAAEFEGVKRTPIKWPMPSFSPVWKIQSSLGRYWRLQSWNLEAANALPQVPNIPAYYYKHFSDETAHLQLASLEKPCSKVDKSLTVSDRFEFKSTAATHTEGMFPKLSEPVLHLLQVHTCCYKCQNFILFYGWVVFHCIYIPHLYLSSVDEHLGCFRILATVNNASMNIGVHVSSN